MESASIKWNIPKLFFYRSSKILSLWKKALSLLVSGLHCVKLKLLFTFKNLLALTKGKWPVFETKRHTRYHSQCNLIEAYWKRHAKVSVVFEDHIPQNWNATNFCLFSNTLDTRWRKKHAAEEVSKRDTRDTLQEKRLHIDRKTRKTVKGNLFFDTFFQAKIVE